MLAVWPYDWEDEQEPIRRRRSMALHPAGGSLIDDLFHLGDPGDGEDEDDESTVRSTNDHPADTVAG